MIRFEEVHKIYPDGTVGVGGNAPDGGPTAAATDPSRRCPVVTGPYGASLKLPATPGDGVVSSIT